MAIRLVDTVKAFSQGNQKFYEAFIDYFNHYRADGGTKGLTYDSSVSFSEKEAKIDVAFRKEIARISNVPNAQEFNTQLFATHPNVKWATFAIVSQLVDAVLPDAITDSIGLYTDVRSIGFGDSASFDIEPRDLFVVSKAGRGMRSGEIHRQFRGQVNVLPENHELTVGVSLYRVLSGAESLARFAAKAVLSMEAAMTRDAYSAFATAMAALDNAGDDALRISGWNDATFTALAQKIAAWNGGIKPVLLGTSVALVNVLPTTDVNYRYDLNSEYVKMGHIPQFRGYDVMEIPQVANWGTEFDTLIDDTKLWLVSPTAGKLVKLVLEGSTISNTDGAFDNANLTQNTTLMKSWGTGIATSALAGTIELS